MKHYILTNQQSHKYILTVSIKSQQHLDLSDIYSLNCNLFYLYVLLNYGKMIKVSSLTNLKSVQMIISI